MQKISNKHFSNGHRLRSVKSGKIISKMPNKFKKMPSRIRMSLVLTVKIQMIGGLKPLPFAEVAVLKLALSL